MVTPLDECELFTLEKYVAQLHNYILTDYPWNEHKL